MSELDKQFENIEIADIKENVVSNGKRGRPRLSSFEKKRREEERLILKKKKPGPKPLTAEQKEIRKKQLEISKEEKRLQRMEIKKNNEKERLDRENKLIEEKILVSKHNFIYNLISTKFDKETAEKVISALK